MVVIPRSLPGSMLRGSRVTALLRFGSWIVSRVAIHSYTGMPRDACILPERDVDHYIEESTT